MRYLPDFLRKEREEAVKKGIKKGLRQAKEETVLKSIAVGLPLDMISRITTASIEEIHKIHEESKLSRRAASQD